MSDELDPASAQVAAGLLPTEGEFRELLQSIVDVARSIFAARASTVFLFDPATDELVFEAVSGSGASLVGRRLPSSTGIAGWVLVTGQTLVVEDVLQDPRFAAEVGADTGYSPHGLMAVPLHRGDDVLGVLEVLDRPRRPDFSLGEVELLSMFADQAAIAVDLLRAVRDVRRGTERSDELAVVARVASLVTGGDQATRDEGLQLLNALERVLARARAAPQNR